MYQFEFNGSIHQDQFVFVIQNVNYWYMWWDYFISHSISCTFWVFCFIGKVTLPLEYRIMLFFFFWAKIEFSSQFIVSKAISMANESLLTWRWLTERLMEASVHCSSLLVWMNYTIYSTSFASNSHLIIIISRVCGTQQM